jgi:hypothetical protein
MSIAYAGVAAFMVGASITSTRGYWLRQPMEEIPEIGGPIFLIGALAGCFLVLFFQAFRKFKSLRRTSLGSDPPVSGIWSPYAWLQPKLLWFLILPPTIAWFVRVVER